MKPFAELSGRDRSIEVLRWLALPVVAFAGDFAGYIAGSSLGRIAIATGLLASPGNDAVLDRALRYLVWMLPAGTLCVLAAAYIAPRMRWTAAIVTAAWWLIVTDWIHHFEPPTTWVTIVAISSGLALVACASPRNRCSSP
jgi:hypothetical protein